MTHWLSRFCLVGSLLAAVLAISSTASATDKETLDNWPSRPVTIIGGAVGGVFDRMARGMAKHLSPVLGVPVVVQNVAGNPSKTANYLLRQPDDGYTYLMVAPAPFLVWAIENKDVSFTMDDFAVINNQWNSATGLMLNNKRSYPDAHALFEDIRQNPLKVAAAVLPRSADQINLLLTLEALDIPVENLRMVYYPSGSTLRTAVAGGQVDFAVGTHESIMAIRDFVRPLAVYKPDFSISTPKGLQPEIDVPTINQMLEQQDIQLDFVPGTLKCVVASKRFQQKHPERYKKIVAAFKQVVSSDAFVADMKKQFIGYNWLGPEASALEQQEVYDLLTTYSELLKKYE